MNRRNVRNIVAGIILTSMVGVGIRSCSRSIGEEVYNGKIDGYKVVYEEDRYDRNQIGSKRNPLLYNRVTLRDGKTIYYFVDRKERSSIFSGSQYLSDKLEEIVIISNGQKRQYSINMINSNELEHVSAVFTKGNRVYNDVRTKILEINSRNEKSRLEQRQKQEQGIEKSIEELFPSLDKKDK